MLKKTSKIHSHKLNEMHITCIVFLKVACNSHTCICKLRTGKKSCTQLEKKNTICKFKKKNQLSDISQEELLFKDVWDLDMLKQFQKS
jgi:hypothetical protein